MLYREEGEQGLGAFLQFGANDKRVNEINWYFGGGVNYRGLIPGRDEDDAGLAVAHALINEDIVDAGGRKDYETSVELTYSAQINEFLRIQPDIQYIINPGAVSGVQDALVIGLRTEIGF